jgi:hypothetical protein
MGTMPLSVLEKRRKMVSLSRRNGIAALESVLSGTEGAFFGDTANCPLEHSFSDGIYVRKISIPAGTVLTGKIHRHDHPNFLLEGTVDVVTEFGSERLVGPVSMISKAGTKRALHAITDLVWVTVHANPGNTTDLKELERNIIAEDYGRLEEHLNSKKMVGEITNCGLVALRHMSDLRDISVRTMISIAEDNGISLTAYRFPLGELVEVRLPAIFHSDNHFVFVSDISQFNEHSFDGIVLTDGDYPTKYKMHEELACIKGAAWVAVGVAAAGTIYKGVQSYSAGKKRKQAEQEQADLIANRPQYEIPEQYEKNAELAQGIVKGYEPYTKTSQLAGQSYMQNRIDNNSANAVAGAARDSVSSPSQLTSLLSAALDSQNKSASEMAVQGAKQREGYQDRYAQATGALMDANTAQAQQDQYKWNQNEFSPYASKVDATTQRIRDYTQRGREREDNAVESGVFTGSMYANALSAKDKLGKRSGYRRHEQL